MITSIQRTCIGLLIFAAGCATPISEQDEIRIGMQTHAQFEQEFGGRYSDSQVQEYVNRVGLEMARYAGRPNLPWQFHVLNSDQINAFAVPGGYIYVTRGLLFRLENEAMLAGVLGHEAGHIAHRHSVQQIQRAQRAQGAVAVVGLLGAMFGYGGVGDVANVVGALTLMSYSRDQEQEADYSGLQYMASGGYDPEGIVQTMSVLQQASGAGGGPPEFLSTHPNPGNRMQYLQHRIQSRYAAADQSGKVGKSEFQQNVLARSPVGMLPLDLTQPVKWCLHCQRASAAISR